jgi:lipid-A-disaccharide synthase
LAGKVIPGLDKAEAMREFGLNKHGPVIGLLPGSRANEIKRLLPVILQTVGVLARRFPTAQFVLNQASSVSDETLSAYLPHCPVPITAVKGRNYDVLQCCDAVITVSGTATLEVALAGVPMAIIYKVTPFTYWLGRWLISINFIGLPNILAGKGIVREFIQHEATADNIAAEIGTILDNPLYARQIKAELHKVKESLGEGGGSAKLARLAAQMLGFAAA